MKLEGEKNDRKDGSGVLFDIVILGDKTGANQEKIGLEAIEGTNMAAPQKSVTGGRLKGKARKEARLRQTSQATASFTYTTPTKNEDGSRPSDRAGVETQGSEAREESSVPHSVGARPESTSTIGLEYVSSPYIPRAQLANTRATKAHAGAALERRSVPCSISCECSLTVDSACDNDDR